MPDDLTGTLDERQDMPPDLAADHASEVSFSEIFAMALRGAPCAVVGLEPEPKRLPVHDWTRAADDDDRDLLAQCMGPTLDIGCGPGRLTEALVQLGHVALGIDVVHEAVGQTRERGASALRRDIFESLPGEGRWQTALLADGNLGIGGDPVALLQRVRELLGHRGRIVVEVAAPGVERKSVWAALEVGETRSRPFRWSVVGVDDIDTVAAHAGLIVTATHRHGARWSAILQEGS